MTELPGQLALWGEAPASDGPLAFFTLDGKEYERMPDGSLVSVEFAEPTPTRSFVAPPPRSRLLWVGVDLDGTLAEPVWTPDNPTSEIGEPITRNVSKVRQLAAEGWKIVIHTSRAWTDYEAIEAWLSHHGISFKEIQCGKPLYAAYIDDRAIYSEDEDWRPRGKDTGRD